METNEQTTSERADGDRTDGEEVESRHACVGVRLEGASERDVDLGLLMVRSFELPHKLKRLHCTPHMFRNRHHHAGPQAARQQLLGRERPYGGNGTSCGHGEG